jgi:hypothetical protein
LLWFVFGQAASEIVASRLMTAHAHHEDVQGAVGVAIFLAEPVPPLALI